jgi:hypothetical protein
VVAAVQLNDQLFAKADKVYDANSNGLLTAKFLAIYLAPAQVMP